jgi:hypothetical protein
MTPSRIATLRAADWLSLGAAPTFAFMAALAGFRAGGTHEMLCSAGSHMSALSGMVPMYVLMSAFHLVPWLNVMSRWRSGARSGRSRNHRMTMAFDRQHAVGDERVEGSAGTTRNRRDAWTGTRRNTCSTTKDISE